MTIFLLVVYILIGVAGHVLWLEYQDRKLQKIISDTNKFVIPEGTTHVHIHASGGGGGGGSGAEPIVAEYKMSPPTMPGGTGGWNPDNTVMFDDMSEPCGNCALYGRHQCSKHAGG